MDFLKSKRNRSLLSEVVYAVLNITLAVVLLVVTLQINSILLPVVILLVSKWRIFAVRPRFWAANLIANTVDIVVGLSHVVFLQATSGSLEMQIILTIGFIVWLLLVKPRSKRLFVTAQALAAMCAGSSALVLTAYNSDPSFFVVGMWILGYVAIRHILQSYTEPMMGFYASIWGFIMAQLGWITYHWQMAYTLPNSADFKFAQLSLLATLLTFLACKGYASYHEHGAIKVSDMMMPSSFVVGTIVLLLAFFNQSNTTL